MIVTLEILSDVYTKPDKNGIQKLIKRNVISKKQFESSQILAEQHITSKGIISKKWCNIKSGEDYFRVNHKFEEIEKLTGHIKVEGFKWKIIK
jgi:hypothetical protein